MPDPAIKKGCASFEYKMSLNHEGMNEQEDRRSEGGGPGHANAVAEGGGKVEGHVGRGGMGICVEDLDVAE